MPADEDETLAAYNGVELKLPDTPMHVLTMGEQELPLTLNVVGGSTTEDFWFATDDAFVGEFSRLGMEEAAPAAEKPAEEEKKDADKEKTDPKHDATVGPAPNALILTAEKAYDPNSGACVYEWKFNGEVYRQLAIPAFEYLGLQAGDYMTALPHRRLHGRHGVHAHEDERRGHEGIRVHAAHDRDGRGRSALQHGVVRECG